MYSTDYNAKLVGYVHEGELDVRSIDEVTYDAFYDIYEHGQDLWNAGTCSKYVIAVVADDGQGFRIIGHVRPDQGNFEDPEEYTYLVSYWEEEPELALFDRHFGGYQWNASYERIFENEYGFPIGQA